MPIPVILTLYIIDTFYLKSSRIYLFLFGTGSNYRELSQYPLTSLYGAEKAIEDWAELGLFYDIIHREGSDYKEEILDGDKVVFTWRPQDHPALKERLKDVSKWLDRSPQ